MSTETAHLQLQNAVNTTPLSPLCLSDHPILHLGSGRLGFGTDERRPFYAHSSPMSNLCHVEETPLTGCKPRMHPFDGSAFVADQCCAGDRGLSRSGLSPSVGGVSLTSASDAGVHEERGRAQCQARFPRGAYFFDGKRVE